MKKIIILFLFLIPTLALAEERWIYINLERTLLINRAGQQMDRPVYYSEDRARITIGGEWIIPEALKALTPKERYQKNNELLILVDVPPKTILPGSQILSDPATIYKEVIFGIHRPVESGTTP